jgi:hypothetical protein
MKRSWFPEEQIIALLREQEAGAATLDVCPKHGISGATFCKWQAKYGGLDVSHAGSGRAARRHPEGDRFHGHLGRFSYWLRVRSNWPKLPRGNLRDRLNA